MTNKQEQTSLKKGNLVMRQTHAWSGVGDKHYGFGVVLKAAPRTVHCENSVMVWWQKLNKKVHETPASLLYVLKDNESHFARYVNHDAKLGGFIKKGLDMRIGFDRM